MTENLVPDPHMRAIVSFLQSGPALEVGVASQVGDTSSFELAHLSLGDDAEQQFRAALHSAIVNPARNLSVRDYHALYKADRHEIEVTALSEVESLSAVIEEAQNLADTDPFEPGNADFVKRLKFYCVGLKSGQESAFFIRRFTSKSELVRRPGIKLMFADGTYHGVDPDKIFLFDEDFDCFVFNGNVFVINKFNFRKLFDQMQAVFRQAETAAIALRKRVPISNFDEFVAACKGQVSMADKIIAAQNRDYFDELTIAKLKPVIDEFSLEIEVVSEGGEERLKFDHRVPHRFKILKLIDDDYLRSAFTAHRYEVNSKSES